MRLTAAVGVLPGVPAGPERVITQQLAALRRRDPELGVTVRASTLRSAATAHRALERVAPWATASVGRVPPSVSTRVRFPPERRAGPFDVYHQFHLDTDPVVPSRRLVVTVHDVVALDWPDEEGALHRHAQRLVQRAQRVVTPSGYSRVEAVERLGADPERTVVVPNGVDHSLFTPHPSVAPVAGRVLYVGGDTPRKNLPRLLSAMAALRADPSTRHVHLLLAGPVARHESHLRASLPHGLPQDAVTFSGHVDDEELVRLYRSAEVLAAPSLHEGFGLPLLEAQACGTPVVTSTATALPEVGGPAARLVDPTDACALADALLEAITESPDRRAERVRRGIAHAAGYTWDGNADRLLGVYRELV